MKIEVGTYAFNNPFVSEVEHKYVLYAGIYKIFLSKTEAKRIAKELRIQVGYKRP